MQSTSQEESQINALRQRHVAPLSQAIRLYGRVPDTRFQPPV